MLIFPQIDCCQRVNAGFYRLAYLTFMLNKTPINTIWIDVRPKMVHT